MADSARDSRDAPALPPWLPGPLAFFCWALLVLALIKPFLAVQDQGTGRHLATGQAILDAGGIPETDPLGYLYSDRPYLDFEWLFDILSRSLVNAAGLSALSLLAFGLFTATLLILVRHLLDNGISLPLALAGGLLASCANYVHLLARPVIVTYFCLALTVWIWTGVLNTGARRAHVFLLPLLFAFWANVHPGFVSGLLFMGLSWAGAFWDNRVNQSHHHKPAALVLALSALATLANPYGWNLHALIFHQVFHSESLAYVQEFLPPDFLHPNGAVLALIVILASGLVLGLRRQIRPRARELLPAVFFLYFALRAQRHILLLVPAVLLPWAAAWDACLAATLPDWIRRRMALYGEIARQARWDWAWCLAGFAAIGLLHHLAYAPQLRVGGGSFSPEAETFIGSRIGQFQRPFTSTIQAGNLLYYFHPRLKVSFDDRVDFYQDTESFAHLRAINLQGDWRGFLEQHQFDSAMLHPEDLLTGALRQEPGWAEIYTDGALVIFRKQAAQPR
jgi:hypothetical protein